MEHLLKGDESVVSIRKRQDTPQQSNAAERAYKSGGKAQSEDRRATPVSLALCLAVKIRPKQRLCACGPMSRIKCSAPALRHLDRMARSDNDAGYAEAESGPEANVLTTVFIAYALLWALNLALARASR